MTAHKTAHKIAHKKPHALVLAGEPRREVRGPWRMAPASRMVLGARALVPVGLAAVPRNRRQMDAERW